MAPAPNVTAVLKGLIRRYVRRHGVDALLPERKAPIENRHAAAILGVANGTKLPSGDVDWDRPRYRSLKAHVLTSREMGGRKADTLVPSVDEFDRSCFTRANLTFRIGGRVPRERG